MLWGLAALVWSFLWPVVLLFVLYLIVPVLQRRIFPPRVLPRDGTSIVVTGAASGIGKATTELLIRLGVFVFACDLNEGALSSAFADDDRVCTVTLDVTSDESVQALVDIIKDAKRPIHGLVNCAGIVLDPRLLREDKEYPRGVAELPIESQAIVIEINLIGLMRMTTALFPMLVHSRACIVNIASVAGLYGFPWMGAYVASKHAVVGYSDSLRVCCIEPGFVNTPMVTSLANSEREKDFSRTVFAKRLQERRFRLKDALERMQGPEAIATVISRVLYEQPPPPHVLVDKPLASVVFLTLFKLPTTWADRLKGLFA